jgi:hypothetical protein
VRTQDSTPNGRMFFGPSRDKGALTSDPPNRRVHLLVRRTGVDRRREGPCLGEPLGANIAGNKPYWGCRIAFMPGRSWIQRIGIVVAWTLGAIVIHEFGHFVVYEAAAIPVRISLQSVTPIHRSPAHWGTGPCSPGRP